MKKLLPHHSPRESIPCKKTFRFPISGVFLTLAGVTYFLLLYSKPLLAADIWSKAEQIMRDVYNKILGISTIAAIVTASVALLMMNFSKTDKTVNESRMWLKRIAETWVILNSLGFIVAYVAPFFNDGRYTG